MVKQKKTNYQRLWRNAKKEAVLKHNYAEDILALAMTAIKENLSLEVFEQAVKNLHARYRKASAN